MINSNIVFVVCPDCGGKAEFNTFDKVLECRWCPVSWVKGRWKFGKWLENLKVLDKP